VETVSVHPRRKRSLSSLSDGPARHVFYQSLLRLRLDKKQ